MATVKIITQLSDYTKIPLSSLPLSDIAHIIERDWKKTAKDNKVSVYAKDYLHAMMCLNSIKQSYGADSGKEIVLRFLTNASTWTGPTAREVKAYLNKIAK